MLDEASVEMLKKLAAQNPSVMQSGMVVDIDDPVINLLLEALANRAQYLNEIGLEYLISRLKQLYVERLPDKGLSTNDFTDELLQKLLNAASKEDLQTVKNELVSIIDGITGIEYMVVSELPSTGKKGVIYLLRLTKFNTVKNLYEEYIWVQDRYELLGMFDTGQDGPFVTTDHFINELKKYIQSIQVGDYNVGPDENGIADISDALLSFIHLDTPTKDDLDEVKNDLLTMINAITSFEYQVVSELPSTGKKGVIYLLRLTKFNTVKNLYEEYIWVQDRYELLGMFDTGQDGPFVTADILTNALKEYIKKIQIGSTQISPDSNNIADISDALLAFINSKIGSVKAVTYLKINNGKYLIPTNDGSVNKSTARPEGYGLDISGIATSVKVNGKFYLADTSGLVDLGDITPDMEDYMPKSGGTFTGDVRFKTGNSNYGSIINMGDGDYIHFAELTDDHLEIKASYINFLLPNTSSGRFTINGTDILSSGPSSISITVNGVEYASSTGEVTLPTLAHQVKINGSTYTVNSSGVVNLGTIGGEGGGGNTVYTGTSEPSASLGSDDDFYYKFSS